MSKLYYVLNDRNDISKGYKEVSEEFIKDYISSFPEEDRAYFINLGYAVMETNQKSYKDYYKDFRRERYAKEEAQTAGLIYLSDIDSDELDGTGVVVDTSELPEDMIVKKIMTKKLNDVLSALDEESKYLIYQIYFNHKSVRQLAKELGVPKTSLNRRKNSILKNLKKFF